MTVQVLKEESGKMSFSRVFGAFVMLSCLAGWWMSGFGGIDFDLPPQTYTFLLVGLLPYLSNKMFLTIAPFLVKK